MANNKNKILMIIASQKFRDEEFLIPKSHFEQKGYVVTVASSQVDASTGMLGVVVHPDILLRAVRAEDYAAVVFVGGNGATEYWENPVAWDIAQKANAMGKVVAAICIGPVILANAGLLKNKKATVWASEVKELKANGAIVTDDDVVVDGHLVTANGPQAALRFAQAVTSLLEAPAL